MSIVTLNQKLKRIELSDKLCIDNEIVFNYFDKIPIEQRDKTLFRALYIGVLALMEDRFSAFLANTSNELGTQLENLKIIFDMKKEIFYKTAQQKGTIAESEIETSLKEYLEQRKIKDEVILTGTDSGKISRNKTGDIVCKLDGSDKKIVIESKFDKKKSSGTSRTAMALQLCSSAASTNCLRTGFSLSMMSSPKRMAKGSLPTKLLARHTAWPRPLVSFWRRKNTSAISATARTVSASSCLPSRIRRSSRSGE